MLTFVAFRDATEALLNDSTNTNFSTAELDTFISQACREAGRYVPHVIQVVFTIESRFGTATSTSSGNLVDNSKSQFVSADTGKYVYNTTEKTWAVITGYTSATTVALSKDIITSGDEYKIFNAGCTQKNQISLTNIDDYLDIERVEYPVGHPRNWDINGQILTVKLNTVEESRVLSAGSIQPNTEVYVWFKKRHLISQLTDLLGAVNNAGGYAAGSTSMAINSLQSTGTIETGQEFTVAGTRGTYTVTADATISGNAATISFFPSLESAVDNTDVVTFTGSTLTPTLEPLVEELSAALAAASKPMDVYQEVFLAVTAVGLATTAIAAVAARITQGVTDIVSGRTETAKVSAILDTANTEIDKIGARLTQAATDIAAGRTEADKIPTITAAAGTAISAIAARITQATTDFAAGKTEADKVIAIILTARTELDKIGAQITLAISSVALGKTEADKVPAIVTAAAADIADLAARVTQATTDMASARTAIALGVTAITEADAEFDLVNPQVDLAVTALSSGNSLVNTVPVGGGAGEYMNQAASDIGAAGGFATSGQIYLQKGSANFTNAQSDIALANGEVNSGMASIREAQARLEQANTDMAANRTYLEGALSDIRNAQAYLQEAQGYFQQGTADLQLNTAYIALGNGELASAAAKAQEANTNLNQAQADMAANRTYIDQANAQLRLGQGYFQEAQGYVMEANIRLAINTGFLGDASAELRAAQTKIQEGQASLTKANTQLNIVRAGQVMETWARTQLREARQKLSMLSPRKYRTSTVYSRA